MAISWTSPAGFWCSTFTCWQLEHCATNSATSLFIPCHQYISLISWYIFIKPGWIEWQEWCASSIIRCRNPAIFETPNRPLLLRTPSPAISNAKVCWFWALALSCSKLGSFCCRDFTSTTRDDTIVSWIVTPLSYASNNLTPKLYNWWSSRTSSRFSTPK